MNPTINALTAAIVGLCAGIWSWVGLNSYHYRLDEEMENPKPGKRWWVIVVAVLAAASIAYLNNWEMLPALAPLTLVGPWLAAVDFDVHRLPTRILIPTAITTGAGICGTCLLIQDWTPALYAAGGAIACGLVFFAVYHASHGTVGFGDVRLAGIIGLAVGTRHFAYPLIGIIVGCILSMIWALTVHKQKPWPFGPWLLAGAWTASLITI
ncbi:MAG: A24 family peptidase [Propionibacteriaceae bacterium]|jgi:leader peptidase (prepilin peptidase)/N-methyltransferase|nr:A24 family peptidase [Propionibacteriaceae bacterium]